MSEKEEDIFDSTTLLVFLLKWKRPLIILCVMAAVISSGVSLVIQEKYKSVVVMFPAATNSLSKALIADNNAGKYDVMSFGEEEQAEQMLQVLNSDYIRTRISEKYALLDHYDIDQDDPYKRTQLFEQYSDNIGFKRTKFQSVEVSVMDISPDTAALIANDISMLLDTVMNKMQKQRAEKALKIVESEYNELVGFMNELNDSLTVLRKLGVNNYESQSEMYTQEMAKALVSGNQRGVDAITERMKVLSEYGSAYLQMSAAIEFQSERLATLRGKYKEARVDATAEIPYKFVVNKAFAAEKKSYPIRWLIVVVSTFSAFLIGILAIIGVENYRRLQELGKL
jgi:capsular polysaccharide biosynthesis protein